MKQILKYNTASGKTSVGVDITCNNGLAIISPIREIIRPVKAESTKEVWTAWLALSSLWAPKKRDMITLAPTDRPTNIVMNKLVIGDVLPTAARELLPENWPTVALLDNTSSS